MPRGKSSIGQVEFVTIWETSSSVKEVMEKTGMTYNAVIGRANNYRNQRIDDHGNVLREGIPLKDMKASKRTPKVNVSELTKLIMDLRKQQEESATQNDIPALQNEVTV
jgi:hypothetical protein